MIAEDLVVGGVAVVVLEDFGVDVWRRIFWRDSGLRRELPLRGRDWCGGRSLPAKPMTMRGWPGRGGEVGWGFDGGGGRGGEKVGLLCGEGEGQQQDYCGGEE